MFFTPPLHSWRGVAEGRGEEEKEIGPGALLSEPQINQITQITQILEVWGPVAGWERMVYNGG